MAKSNTVPITFSFPVRLNLRFFQLRPAPPPPQKKTIIFQLIYEHQASLW